MIDLNLIYTFLEVAKIGNLNVASRKLCVTPSALSQRIKSLEGQIGRNLFLRKRTGMVLSNSGRELLEICSGLKGDAETIENWMMSNKGYVGGRIAISTISLLPSVVFPDFLGTFLKQYPQISLAIRTNYSAIIEDDVLTGKADLGVIVGNCQKPSLKTQRILLNNNVLMVCSPDYFLAKKNRITRKDLSEAQILWHGDRRSRTLQVICKKLGIPFLGEMGILSLPDMESCKQHALKGIGVAFVAKMFLHEELKRGSIVALPGLDLVRPVYLISRNEKYESPAIKIFKDAFIKYCMELDKKWGK